MDFASEFPTIMHIDLNSCFATIEQQANPLLRGKPVAVAAYTTSRGCILAASTEAKRLGVKTGMRVIDGRTLVPRLVVLPPDPEKYRWVNQKLQILLGSYTPYCSIESIDEIVMDVKIHRLIAPLLHGQNNHETMEPWKNNFLNNRRIIDAMTRIAQEIKKRIKAEIGEWLTVSIGIAPNRYLAKVASGLHKPDGLDVITKETITPVFERLTLEDLCGIKQGIANRLRASGITTPVAMLAAPAQTLVRALNSITGYHWWRRLHGYEDGVVYKKLDKEKEVRQKTFGQSFALGIAHMPTQAATLQILSQLVAKMGRRLRRNGFTARGVGVSLLFTDGSHWHEQKMVHGHLFADGDFYCLAGEMLAHAPARLIRTLAITTYKLTHDLYAQESLLAEEQRKRRITQTLDAVHDRFGERIVITGRMLRMEQRVVDRIAFGRARELV